MKASWKGKRGTPTERGYGADWVKLRNTYLQNHPLCEHHGPGCKGAARIVHHVKPVTERPDLRLERSNLMSVCDPCHRQLHGERSPGVVVAVVGAPGSGKRAYVDAHKGDGDMVFDWSTIARAHELPTEPTYGELWFMRDTRDNLISRVRSGTISRTLWFITTSYKQATQKADQYVVMGTTLSDCIKNIRARDYEPSMKVRMDRHARYWFMEYGKHKGKQGATHPPGSPPQGGNLSTTAVQPSLYPHGRGNYEPQETSQLLGRIDRAGSTGWKADPESG